MTLAEFLLARIAEDEEAFRRDFGPDESPGTWLAWGLAECEAKRHIIELHKRVKGEAQFDGDEYNTLTCHECFRRGRFISWPCPTLRMLALPYAAHPDYLPEWKP